MIFGVHIFGVWGSSLRGMCDGKDRVGKLTLVLPDHCVISGKSLNLSGPGTQEL